MTGDEDDRQFAAALRQGLLQFQAAHRGHSDVEHQATRPVGCRFGQEGFGRSVRTRLPAHRIEQEDDGTSQHGVIVDDMDERRLKRCVHGLADGL